MDRYFPGTRVAPARPRDASTASYAYRARNALPTWEDALDALLGPRRPVAIDPVRRIADAVLYEGYILWPYRRSAMKNQQRWTFGGVYPRAHSRGRATIPGRCRRSASLEGGGGRDARRRVRFLHVVERRWPLPGGRARAGGRADGGRRAPPGLGRGDRARDHGPGLDGGELAGGSKSRSRPARSGRSCAKRTATAGAIVRTWQRALRHDQVSAERLAPALHRVTVRIANTSPFEGGDREDALRQTFCSSHTVLHARGGEFVSLTDPPEPLRTRRERARTWAPGPCWSARRASEERCSSSPIILPDYPQIAPESPGDLFDGGEIDQLLTLSILSLTDEERREMRDPTRARGRSSSGRSRCRRRS